jgi:hypothetical protein
VIIEDDPREVKMAEAKAASPADELIQMAEAVLRELTGAENDLTDAERTMLRAAPKGERAQCGPNFSDQDPANDPAHVETWGADRTIRAWLLRWLCVDSRAKMRVDPRGVQVHGARVYGELDMSFVVVPFPLGLWHCHLTHPANLISAEIPALSLAGCRIGMLLADCLVTKGNVFLRHGFLAEGRVQLCGAKIGGNLDCVGGTFRNPAKPGVEGTGTALHADGISVDGGVFLSGGFRAEGQVRLLGGVQIGGQLVCTGGTFFSPAQEGIEGTGTALSADGISADGGVFLTAGFHAEGEVRLLGAKVGTDLDCNGGTFHNPARPGLNRSGKALNTKSVEVKSNVFLGNGFRAGGEVCLQGAQIGGDLECVGGTFYNPAQKDVAGAGTTLDASGIRVKGKVLLTKGFRAGGKVSMVGAEIGGDLDCAGGTFYNPAQKDVEGAGTTLNASGIRVKGRVSLTKGFRAGGEVSMVGAEIGGDLDCAGGTFYNPAQEDIEGTGTALTVDGVTVDGSVNLCQEFHAEGAVRLIGAQIGADLNCGCGTFSNLVNPGVVKPGLAASGGALHADRIDVKGSVFLGDGFSAEGEVLLTGAEIGMNLDCVGGAFNKLQAEGISVGKILFWKEIREPAKATLNLTNATVDAVVDDRGSWPGPGRLYLDGFVYGRFLDDSTTANPTAAKERLEWLRRVEPFTPQPYRQLAKVLRDAGHNRGASDVLFKMEDRLWSEDNRWIAWVWPTILRWTVGYGYRPRRAFWCLLALTVLGWGIYGTAQSAGEMVPTDEKAFQSFKDAKGQRPENYPRFVPLYYSLENSVPLVKLGLVDRWQPNPSSQAPAPSDEAWCGRLQNLITDGRFLRFFRWIQIVAGWVLATLFVAGLTGTVRKV